MIMIRHYFPGVDIPSLSEEDFAMISEDALWLHSQMTQSGLGAMMASK